MTGDLKIEKEVSFLGKEITVRCDEAELEEGVLMLPYAEVVLDDSSTRVTFDESIKFSNVIPEIAEQLLSRLTEEDEGEGDEEDQLVYGKDFTDPRFHGEDSQKAELLQFVYDNGPTTSNIAKEEIEMEYASTFLSDLAGDGLVGVVGHNGRSNVYWITPKGVGEVFAYMGSIEMNHPGDELQDLFDMEDMESEDEEEEEENGEEDQEEIIP